MRAFGPVYKDQSEPERPFIQRAELANSRFLTGSDDDFITCSGKGFTVEDARRSALGEAVERYCAMLWRTEQVRRCRRAELPGPSLDPRRLVLYRPEQYEALHYHPYHDDAVVGWIEARSLATGDTIWVPALAALMAYDVQPGEAYLFPLTSSGLAAGPTLAHAILNAAYEVIERDAFMNLWLHRLPTMRIDPMTHPDEHVRTLCAAYARRHVTLELYRLVLDHPVEVFVGIGVQLKGEGPAAVVGLGAALDPVVAARGALLEVAQVRPALRQKLRDPEIVARLAELLEDPHRVASLEDHDLLYASPGRLASFDFMRRRPIEPFDWGRPLPASPRERIEMILDPMRAQRTDLLYCAMTTPDVARFGLHSVRAIIPDYQPIHFGRAERRLAAERLYDIPRRLGLRDAPVTPADLNDDPHPLA